MKCTYGEIYSAIGLIVCTCVCVCALGQWCAVHSVAFGDCEPIPENLVFHDKPKPCILHGHSPDCSLSGKGGHRNKLWVHFIVQGFRPDFGKRVLSLVGVMATVVSMATLPVRVTDFQVARWSSVCLILSRSMPSSVYLVSAKNGIGEWLFEEPIT